MGKSISNFRLSFDIPEIDKYFPSKAKPCSSFYEAELTIDDDRGQVMELRVFYDSPEYLGHKIMNWEQATDTGPLQKIVVDEIISPENLLEIDFAESRFYKISTGAYDKHRAKDILTISFKNLKKFIHGQKMIIQPFN
jgi:hypothetical protein